MIGAIKNLVKKVFSNVQISLEVEFEITEPEYIYSLALDAWFHYADLQPLDTTERDVYAALTPAGFVVFAHECQWETGEWLADVPEAQAPVEDAAARLAACWNGESAQFPGFGQAAA